MSSHRKSIMKRKYSGGLHEEAIDRLCFVCGEIIKDNKGYMVEKNLELLGATLNCPEIFTIPDVTPTHFCKKCQLTLSRVKRGEVIATGRKLLDWIEPGGGYSLIRSGRYVPQVRAGFWTKNPLKTGVNID